MKKRTCVTCGERKAVYLFYASTGLSNQCGYCRTYPPVPVYCAACHQFKSVTSFKHKTDTECLDCTDRLRAERTALARKNLRASPAYSMWDYAKSRARKAKVPFTITVDDIVIPARCPIRGVRLTVPNGKPSDNTMSLDRVKPELGYVPDNVRVVSMRANRQKNDLDADTAQKIADYINKDIK